MDENKNYQTPVPDNTTDQCVKCDAGACSGGCCSDDIGRCNLTSTNWLEDVPDNDYEIVEVLFKNTRRGFYRNSTHIPLKRGDWVAVEANPGHDIGRVGLMGRLVQNQMKRVNLRKNAEILRVFRKAKPADMERYEQAKAIYQLRRQHIVLKNIDALRALPELDSTDINRLQYYLRFDKPAVK